MKKKRTPRRFVNSNESHVGSEESSDNGRSININDICEVQLKEFNFESLEGVAAEFSGAYSKNNNHDAVWSLNDSGANYESSFRNLRIMKLNDLSHDEQSYGQGNIASPLLPRDSMITMKTGIFAANFLANGGEVMREERLQPSGSAVRSVSFVGGGAFVADNDNGYEMSSAMKSNRAKRGFEESAFLSKPFYQCQICAQQFDCKSKYLMHQTRHSEVRNHRCSECGSAFKTKGDLTKHVRAVHQKEIRFRCSECQMTFFNKSHVTTHMERYHLNISFPCDLCQKIFKTKFDLFVHRRRVHEYSGLCHCDLCGKPFKAKKSLISHQRNNVCSKLTNIHPTTILI